MCGPCRTVDAQDVAAEEDGHEGQKSRGTAAGGHNDDGITFGFHSAKLEAGTNGSPIDGERDFHSRV